MKHKFLIIICILSLNILSCTEEELLPGGSGFIEVNEVIISAETSGRMLKRYVREGDIVSAGDTLAIIDPSRLQLGIASAHAVRKVAEENLRTARIKIEQVARQTAYVEQERERVQKMVDANSATKQLLDKLNLDFDQSIIAMKSAKTNVSRITAELAKIDADIAVVKRDLLDCYLIAPISGNLIETYLEPGELAIPGKALMKIAPLDSVWVKIYLPAPLFANVQIGDPASVTTESGDSSIAGKVVWTSDEAEFTPRNVQTMNSRTDLVYAVKIDLPNESGKLKIGMAVYVTLEK